VAALGSAEITKSSSVRVLVHEVSIHARASIVKEDYREAQLMRRDFVATGAVERTPGYDTATIAKVYRPHLLVQHFQSMKPTATGAQDWAVWFVPWHPTNPEQRWQVKMRRWDLWLGTAGTTTSKVTLQVSKGGLPFAAVDVATLLVDAAGTHASVILGAYQVQSGDAVRVSVGAIGAGSDLWYDQLELEEV
jgi:hypothetical protein